MKLSESNPEPDRAIATFAQRLTISDDTARASAAVIIEAVTVDDVCRLETPPCGFEVGGRIHRLVEHAAAIDTTGQVLASVSRNLEDVAGDDDIEVLIRVIAAHPASATVFRSLLEWTGEPLYLVGLLASGRTLDDQSLIAAAAETDLRHDAAGEHVGWAEAMLEAAELDIARTASPTARASIAQIAILRKLERGLEQDGVAHYDTLSTDVRRLLPIPAVTCDPAKPCERLDRIGYRFVDELAAALASGGRRAEALRLLQRPLKGFRPRTVDESYRHEALLDAVAPKYPKRDLFDLFIRGHLAGQVVPKNESDVALIRGVGWLFEIEAGSPALRRVVAARLRATGYAGMASFLSATSEAFERRNRKAAFEAVATLFPDAVRDRRAHWQRRIQAASASLAAAVQPLSPSRVSTGELPPWWIERRLPGGIQPWRETEDEVKLPEALALPVNPDAIIRYEAFAGEHLLLYASANYDLPGEVPAFGLWFAQTVGGKWSKPLYLGLQQHYPYVVTSESRLPLLDGNLLRIEVQVRAIDPATVTFPPVALGYARSEDGVYLEIDLGQIVADRDGDGLTDIEERRLGLDFSRADTDGDGLADGVDPLPLTAFQPRATRSSGLARAILSQIVGDNAKASDTHFLVADPAMFSGISTSFRLLVYSASDVAALARGSAPFYPPRIKEFFSSLDGRTHYVSWSATWTGGSFIVTCATIDKCDVEVLSHWIT